MLLTCHVTLVEKVGVLPSIERVITDVLCVTATTRSVSHAYAIVLSDWIHRFELIHLVHWVILIVLVIADRIALVKVALIDSSSLILVTHAPRNVHGDAAGS